MIKCILLDKENINEIKIKNFSEDDLYKKCNFKNNNNFDKIKTWCFTSNSIELWGKIQGLNNNKNNNLILIKENINVYGKCIFILKNNENNIISLDIDNFNKYFNSILETKENIEIKESEKAEKAEKAEKQSKEAQENIINNYINELEYEVYSYIDENI